MSTGGIYIHRNRSKRNLHRIERALSNLSSETIKILNPLLCVVFLEFLWFGISFYIAIRADPVKALDVYSTVGEYLMMSLLITVGFGVLFDVSMWESGKK